MTATPLKFLFALAVASGGGMSREAVGQGVAPCLKMYEQMAGIRSTFHYPTATLRSSNPAFVSVLDMISQMVSEHRKRFGEESPGTTSTLLRSFNALQEIVENAVKWGNGSVEGRAVHLQVETEGARIIIRVSDESGSFHDVLAPSYYVNVENRRNRPGIDPVAVWENRARTGHDPDRLEGAGGNGVNISAGRADEIRYEPYVGPDNRIQGTTVVLIWDFSLPRYR